MKSYRMLAAVALLLGVALLAVGCSSDKDVAAKVNGEKISLTELDQQVEQLKKQYPTMFEGADGEGRLLDFKQRLLDNMINQILIEQAAKDQGIKVTDEDVNAHVEQLKSGFESQEKFEQALQSAGMDEEGLRKQVREQLITQKLMDKIAGDDKPSNQEIEVYYDTNRAQFEQKAATRASHILFAADDKATADKVLAEIKGGADFAAMAKKYSTDTATKDKGGDLGWPTTPYVTEFEAALAKLKPGQVSALVKTQFGWHIIKATDTREASTKKLDEVQAQIEQILIQQNKADAYQKYIEKLREDADITILIAELKTPEESTAATISR